MAGRVSCVQTHCLSRLNSVCSWGKGSSLTFYFYSRETIMLSSIFAIISPVIICAGIGLLWNKSGKDYDTELITSLVSYVGTPCLIFYSLATIELQLEMLYQMALASFLANIIFVICGAVLLKATGLSLQSYLQTISFPNIGNIGLPLCYLAYGNEGLALAIAFFTVYAVLQLTVGAAFVSGSFTVKQLIHMPIIPATLIAIVFLAGGYSVPLWLRNTTQLIGDLTIPLMLFTLGVSLGSLRIGKLKIPLFLSTTRLIMGIAVGLLLVRLLSLEGAAAGVVILQCSMPAAVFCYLFAVQFNRHPEDVAGAVIISTLVGFATLPMLLWYVL